MYQSEKKQILRRLNQNLKAQTPDEVEEERPTPAERSPAPELSQRDTEKQPPLNGQRNKWDAAVLPVILAAQQNLEDSCVTASTELSPCKTKLSCLMH